MIKILHFAMCRPLANLRIRLAQEKIGAQLHLMGWPQLFRRHPSPFPLDGHHPIVLFKQKIWSALKPPFIIVER
jgi:hypothetical protein